MNITQYTEEQLRQELDRRAGERAKAEAVAHAQKWERSDAIASALRACAVAAETGVYSRWNTEPGFEPMVDSILDKVGKLTVEIAYRGLSGGGSDPQSGMNAGWESEGFGPEPGLNETRAVRLAYRDPIDAVLALCDPRHEEERNRYSRGY